MTQWTAFAGVTGAVLLFVLFLARVSQGYVASDSSPTTERRPDRSVGGADPSLSPPQDGEVHPATGPHSDREPPVPEPLAPEHDDAGGLNSVADDEGSEPGTAATRRRERRRSPGHEPTMGGVDRRRSPGLDAPASTASLLANVTLSQGVFLVVLAASAWFAGVPAAALGLGGIGPFEVAAGVGLGVALYLANEVGAGVAERVGIGHDERLRELLAPESLLGWVGLLVVVLPVIAGFEELLFRAALVGAIPAGFGVSPWVMVGFSSVAFGVGHGAQGPAGIAVTGALGAVLATGFVLTGSLVAVVVAHYLVNALEFVVHEGLGMDPAAPVRA